MINQQSEELRAKGNEQFRLNEYKTAIRYYSEAIDIDSGNDTLYSNRAKCHQLLNNLPESIEDSLEAINLNPNNIKAYLIYGVSLCE